MQITIDLGLTLATLSVFNWIIVGVTWFFILKGRRKTKKLIEIKDRHIEALTKQLKDKKSRFPKPPPLRDIVKDIAGVVKLPPSKKNKKDEDNWEIFDKELPYTPIKKKDDNIL